MSQQLPHKIVLKSTTKISLNERFSNIQKVQNTPAVQHVRAQMAATQMASAKNRRLAQQMGNRPTVQAALRIKQRVQKSLKQRLGVQSRLSFAGRIQRGRGIQARGMQARGRGSLRGGQLRGRGQIRGQMRGQMRGQFRGQFRGRGRGITGTRGIGSRGASTRARGGHFRGRARAAGRRGTARSQVTKDDLDSQLDQYMAGGDFFESQ